MSEQLEKPFYAELIARLEKATGPDLVLDLAIHEIAALEDFNKAFWVRRAMQSKSDPLADAKARAQINAPLYTASLDAAMMLIEPGEKMSVLQEVCEVVGQRGWHEDHFESNVACEICATALRAMENK